MRIAYFTDTYAPELNGVTNTLSRLGSYLDDKRIQQVVFAPEYEEDNSICFSNYRNVHRYEGIVTALSTESRLAFPAFWEIDEICDRFNPDIIHVTTEFGIGFRGMRYALSRGIPLVTSFHTDYCKYLKYHNLEFFKPIIEMYLTWFHGLSAKTLVPSMFTLDELSSKGYNHLDIWSRGSDTSSFNPEYRNEELRNSLGKGKFIFLYVGRLSREKNIELLLHAASEIEQRFPGQTCFVFTGDGPYAETIQTYNVPNVVCTGFKRGKELSEIYASADCFAFPSGTETFGNVVLEAMASGLPVAGVASGGVMDFLTHDYNALLSPSDDNMAFAENLASFIKNPGLKQRLATNARRTALSRNWDNIFDGLLDVYENTIAEARQQSMGKSA